MTCRQLFYQMVSRGLIEKEESEYQNTRHSACDRVETSW
jgi:hypothetical protein